jgi:hypothetical protein
MIAIFATEREDLKTIYSSVFRSPAAAHEVNPTGDHGADDGAGPDAAEQPADHRSDDGSE